MRLPMPLKIELVKKFAPLLYLDVDEPAYPVSPRDYAEHAALWSSVPPNHSKIDWGLPDGSDRQPLIPRGGISLNPAHDVRGTSDPDGDGVPEFFLGQNDHGTFPFLVNPDKELWLDHQAWQDGAKVTPASLNRRSAGLAGADLAQPWFSADVWSFEDLSDSIGGQALSDRFGLGPDDRPAQLDGLVVVAYHFLFPAHRQRRKNTAHPPESDPYSGDFEGDWSTFAVITRAPAIPPNDVDDCTPLQAAFGQRWRPVAPDHDGHVFERMLLRPWPTVLKVGDHPVVVAAPGTHNLYPHDIPQNPDGTITPQWLGLGQSTSEPANDFVRESTENSFAGLFALKGILGFLLGGPIGLAVGGAAAGAEAAALEKEGVDIIPELEASPPPESDDPLSEDASDIEKDKIGSPPGIQNFPLVDPMQSEIREWLSPPEEALVDDSLLLSPYGSADRPTFSGRWGVRCTSDPFLIRSGITFPSYRSQIIDGLLTQK